ncbi:MAG: imidazoleglycerol-phosphate dehydratase HisB [Coriobacteriia bacterium]|nr:imidazoleglycerol-phosphate dehydratase HisB [Coriobacteriia bacterium]
MKNAQVRNATVQRTTGETSIELTLAIDGSGTVEVETGVPFFDHMLDALARHAGFDLSVKASGDVEVDAHHTVEDVGIVLGQAIAQALGDKAGIVRFGQSIMPMDEALVIAAIDVSGRGQCYYEVDLPIEIIGTFDTTLTQEFLAALAREAGLTLHVRSLAGTNAHHIVEAAFKAVARALRTALTLDPRVTGVPSTKGSL